MVPPSSRPRILHLISTLEGGAGRGTLEIVNRLQSEDRYEVRLCVLGGLPADLTLPQGVSVEFLHAPVHQRSMLFRRLMRLRGLITRWQPQLIHSHLWPTALVAGLVSPRSLPHLIHIRDTPPSLQSQRWGPALRRALLRRIGSNPRVRFVSVSSAAADYTAETLPMDRRRIQTILNGVELDRFLAVPHLQRHPESPFVIACAGRLIADKGFDLLLKAVSQLTVPRDQFRVLIAGTGSAEPGLRELCRVLEIDGCVEFVGQVDNMPDFLSQADLFVHASVAAEGLSRALIESQAAGRPVVASEHAGAHEAILNGKTGLIVPGGDSAALAGAIDSLLLHPDRLTALGAAARQHASTAFAAERVVTELCTIYSEMLD